MGKESKDQAPTIYIVRENMDDFQIPLSAMGTGIMEMVHFLTNIVAREGEIFILEEPELHLHPGSQKKFFQLIQDFSKRNQFIILTHSPYFIDVSSPETLVIVRYANHSSHVRAIFPGTLDTKDRIRFFKEFQDRNRELFFSRLVLLVEGDTELGMIPILAREINIDLNGMGVEVCALGGVQNFGFFRRLLDALYIPWVLLCDADYEGSLDKNISQNRVHILRPDLEGYLETAGFGNEYQDAKTIHKNSKPRAGIHLANSICQSGKSFPSEFQVLFEKIERELAR